MGGHWAWQRLPRICAETRGRGTAIWEVRSGEGGLGGGDQHKGCLRTLAGHGSPFPRGLARRSCVSLSHLQLGSGCGSGFADWSLSGSSGGSEEEDPCGLACLYPAMVSLGKRGTLLGLLVFVGHKR